MSLLPFPGGGGIGGLGAYNALSAIYVYAPTVFGQSVLDLGSGWTLDGGLIDLGSLVDANGNGCHGIQANRASVSDMRVVRRPASSVGISSTEPTDLIADNFVDDANGGTRFSFSAACTAKGNRGYATTATTDVNLQATLHAESGEITTANLATLNGQYFTVTLLNNLISANSRVLVRLKEGTNTKYPIALRGAEFNGGIWITGDNISGETLDGSVKIVFEVTT